MVTNIYYREGSAVVSAEFTEKSLTDITISGPDRDLRPGDVYVGRISKTVPSIHAAFVDIGADRDCFLKLSNVTAPIAAPSHKDGELHAGDAIIVQIEREDGRNKPATVVTEFSLTGVNLVLIHGKKGVRCSAKIPDGERKSDLRRLAGEWIDGSYTLMVRTHAYETSDEEIYREFTVLRERYFDIAEKGLYKSKGNVLVRGLPAYLCELRDNRKQIPDRVLVQGGDIAEELRAFSASFAPSYTDKIEVLGENEYPLSAQFDMKKHLSELSSRKLWLKSGAFLVIEPTEAMTVIDVNTGKSSVSNACEKSFLPCNIEAAREIARQLRLRNISGIIIIDFINMNNPVDRETLLAELKAITSSDPTETKVVDMTPLGLVEITRMKRRRPLSEDLRKYLDF